ncbi:MAG: zinc ABC transporter substrate-binding protein [Acidimicrobiaceae bacterium]|nr:zinc ABC transporter substrate-binding protein [Ilumatobacter sp.]MCB9382457.1 zinc ABC transporter substrate-binding protein [Acidimicrobiaceae bacterium]MCO5329765.1 metal ABC transporter substrate-binding protein [Ilumatobacteraceae bacterium]
MIRRLAAAALSLALVSVAAGCSDDSGGEHTGGPTVVVTYSVLGAVVRDIVGDSADVVVLMPNGADPHEWSPSAKDVEAMLNADVLVENGLGLEGNLQDPLSEARSNGVRVFTVSDHITVRKVKAGEGADAEDPDQAPGADDPHLWMDPLTMQQWIEPFAAEMKAAGVDVSAGAARVSSGLDELNGEIETMVNTIPANQRKLVTGHESMGYFAERYGFRLIGAIIPAVTSQAEASAGELADLEAKIRDADVPAIFAEIGTSAATVEAVAADTGTKVVELSTHNLPDDGTYRSFMLAIAAAVTGALA